MRGSGSVIQAGCCGASGNGAVYQKDKKAYFDSIAPRRRRFTGKVARMGFSMEAPMNTPVLLAAVMAALPICAQAQDTGPGAPPGKTAAPSGCSGLAEAPRAASALPARASTRPAPQLGSVAPNSRVPSHAETPSLRAMRAARAKQAGPGPDAPADAGIGCAAPAADSTTHEEVRKP